MRSFISLAVVVGSLLPVGLSAQTPGPGGRAAVPPAGLNAWQQSRTPGVDVMLLVGTPGAPGAVVYRVRAAAGVEVGPHWHTQTMHLTVLSGTLMLAVGDPPDTARAQPYAPGSFLRLPAETRHLEWFEGETVVHVETAGPLETVFVQPSDDPRSQVSR